VDNLEKVLDIGLDVGSTTVKIVVLDPEDKSNKVIYSDYQRHNADIKVSILQLLKQTKVALEKRYKKELGNIRFRTALTGSAGLGIAKAAGISFVQEVIAETEAIKILNPEADVIVELGGEDAKITYLHPTPEQRMNGTCAGGTGAFIDQMASLLKTDAPGLNLLAAKYTNLYPIASRCGVFAKTDLQPLINDGAPPEDLAASIFQAVATQTIAGLACGRAIRGNVVFLGGPLYFLPELRAAFVRALSPTKTGIGPGVASSTGPSIGPNVAPSAGTGADNKYINPVNAQLYVAIGAAFLARKEAIHSAGNSAKSLNTLIDSLENYQITVGESNKMRTLFETPEELAQFRNRHNAKGGVFNRAPINKVAGQTFLGIDAGSTTIKAVLIDEDSNIVYDYYSTNEGDPIHKAIEIVKDIRKRLPKNAVIANSCVTGYGEGLIKEALHIDEGEVETVAHYTAAEFVSPGVSSIIDIGGQDMKYLTIGRSAVPEVIQSDIPNQGGNDNIGVAPGVIESIAVNEACSSGCGSFLQTFAAAVKMSVEDFAKAAVESKNPVDLGSRCTVFMNSSVKQAQKEGATLGDISAGLSYSVVKNALYKVIKLRDAEQLGDNIVVQGGTFLNDAVLRAFEILTGKEVVRPEISGLMGAFGAALISLKRWNSESVSGLLSTKELENLKIETEMKTCPLCPNKCKLSITNFSDGGRYVSGNRCERGGDANSVKSELPNLYDYKYERTFDYKRLRPGATDPVTGAQVKYKGKIGIPRVLNMYENYPFWHTVLTRLGFEVVLSGRSDHKMFEKGMDSIASENICYPAKLAHGHIVQLIEKGIDRIFYPCITFEAQMSPKSDNDYNCPIVANYPQVIANNIEQLAGARAAGNRREAEIEQYGHTVTQSEIANKVGNDGLGTDPAIDFIYPYFSLKNHENTIKRVYEEFARFGVTEEEAKLAVEAGYAEDLVYKNDIIEEGQKALDYAKMNNLKAIVLAGRPYHSDPEVNHGIPLAITSLKMVVLTEDAAAGLYDRAIAAGEIEELKRPLRVMDQWSYHSRLYKSAAFVAQNPGLELVQLNSFGCGLDAVTTDQTAEILQAYGDIYTVLKIDEVSNLGAAKIRLRSLAAAVNERNSGATQLEIPADPSLHLRTAQQVPTGVTDNASNTYGKPRVSFTKEMKQTHTIIAPQMHPILFDFLSAIFKRSGYKLDVLKKASKEDIEVGLKYTNNDACFPAVLTIGQLVNAFKSGKYDPNNTSLVISQTGGMCRATNYAALLRLALAGAGYSQVAVLTISTQQLEKHPGFKLGPTELLWTLRAVFIADLLYDVILRCRPYETVPGSVNECYHKWRDNVNNWILGKVKTNYKKIVHDIVKDFDSIPLKDIPRKPRVGLVGEILVKYHPDSNNHVLNVIEDEGCEAVLPGIVEFLTNKLYISKWNWENIGRGSKSGVFFKPISTKAVDMYKKPVIDAYSKSSIYQGARKFQTLGDMQGVVENARTCTSLGVQAGEGWLLTGEIVELIHNDCPNIIVANPFACLPNHVTGRGMFQEIRRQHPEANIVSIDYDPGASEVNQINRIKLMISTAKS
jgi:activator of 2-hydroxyglutaryl-CoA dehydratase/predicted nucleotide-binding protein (sugar kinase/HSP70/actin superfamily)